MSITIPILAQEPDFIVVDKPAGLDFHSQDGSAGLVQLVRAQTGLTELYAVHRLDKLTSGLLLLARSSAAASALGELFSQHQIRKYYLAISAHKPSKKQGKVRGGIEKGRGGSYRLVREGGQLAITQFFSYGLGEGLRLFALKPLTGRTHQLRVTLKSLGSPILGDSRYAGGESDRGYLHAYELAFSLHEHTYHYQCPPSTGTAFLATACSAQLASLGSLDALPWPAA
ncbi:TIGR01621 family pseudouridine synthase [Chitinibacter tainanensis]|uniref:TIGR01621 family pseudouridine synthase n=1 Tax=Chitinibacter tainanensis TaxID=230667 RepID=UPI00042299F8|nr:TIGR01621 family pseudouridine synthase [Chitinibacter tainanensis]